MSSPSSSPSDSRTSPAASSGWRSSLDIAGAAKFLRSARTAVLLTHAKPDGDAAGSTLAMARTLAEVGVKPTIYYISPAPRWLPTIAGSTPHVILDASAKRNQPSLAAADPDIVVITDTGSWPQLDEVRPFVEKHRDRTLVIDHHLHGDADVSRHKLLGLGEASTTLVLAPLCAELLGCQPRAFPTTIAEPIYLGLATDTQWFKLSNVSPKALHLAGDLLDAGVNHTRLYELIEQQDVASRWKLLGRALSSLELHNNERVALMRLTLRDFTDCGADRNDTSGFADMVLHIASVQVVCVLTEADLTPGDPPTTKVSMRSKPGANPIDVNQITMSLGGGGHARAAGAKMVGASIDAARDRVLAALRTV